MAALQSSFLPTVDSSLKLYQATRLNRNPPGHPIRISAAKKINDEKVVIEKCNQGRRNFLLGSVTGSALLFPLVEKNTFLLPSAFAESNTVSELTLYENAADAYSFFIPQDWKFGESKLGTRKIIGFYPEGDSDTNVNLVITMLGADFTSMGSFGTAENFGENLVNMMDRSYLRPPGQEAKLIESRSKNGMYYVEYTIKKPGEEKRHFISVVGINFNGIYNRLFTLTGQYLESDSAMYKNSMSKVISSFKLGARSA